MPPRLGLIEGKVALVTGAASDIGRATAREGQPVALGQPGNARQRVHHGHRGTGGAKGNSKISAELCGRSGDNDQADAIRAVNFVSHHTVKSILKS